MADYPPLMDALTTRYLSDLELSNFLHICCDCPTFRQALGTSSTHAEIGLQDQPEVAAAVPPVRTPQILVVPQRRWNGRNIRHASVTAAIEFHMADGSFLMAKTAFDCDYTGMLGRKDEMSFGGTSAHLRFEWPGYRSWARAFNTVRWSRERNPITREKLCYEIAKVLRLFIERSKNQAVENESVGWKVGINGIAFENLAIISLNPVSSGSWQPVFGLVV